MTRFRKVFQQTARRKVNVAYNCMLQSPTIECRNHLTQRSWHATLASDCVVEELWHYRGYRQTSQFWRSLGPQPNRRPRRPLCREGSQHRVHGDSVASVLKAFGPRGRGEVATCIQAPDENLSGPRRKWTLVTRSGRFKVRKPARRLRSRKPAFRYLSCTIPGLPAEAQGGRAGGEVDSPKSRNEGRTHDVIDNKGPAWEPRC